MSRAQDRVLLGFALLVFALSAGLIGRRLWPRTAPPSIPAPEAAAQPKAAEPTPLRVSTIIDLPGDPVVVRRATIAAPRELKFALPVALAANAPKVETSGYYLNAPLVSTAGGYMGKYSSSGSDADSAAAQLAYNAAVAASGEGVDAAAASDDDGGDATPANAAALMITPDRSNRIEIALGDRPALKQSILKTVVGVKISDLLISNGFDGENAKAAEAAFRSQFNILTLPPGGAALVYGSLNAAGDYQVDELAIWEGREYVGAIGLFESGIYGEAARPRAPEGLIDDAPIAAPPAHFTLADGIYSAGLRNGVAEATIREAVELMSGLADLKATLPADETLRLLYARDPRVKGKARGRVVYVGLSGGAGPFDCYAYESGDGGYVCYDPKGVAAAPSSGGGGALPVSSGASAPGGLLAPIKGAPITSLFGMRFHPILHILRLHAGIDFGAPEGSQVRASADGKVEIASEVRGFGNHIRLQHQGFETSYSHLSVIPAAIHPGVEVKQGDIIALSGNTGLSTGPHLHFEYYLNGQAVDPLPHVSPQERASAASLSAEKSPTAPPTPPVPTSPGRSGEAEKAAFPAFKAAVDATLESAER